MSTKCIHDHGFDCPLCNEDYDKNKSLKVDLKEACNLVREYIRPVDTVELINALINKSKRS